MNYETYTGALRTDDDEPDLKGMTAALQDACSNAAAEVTAMELAENTRFAWWEDQQDNGRKPNLVNSRPAEPWPGASDVRVRLADEIIVEQVKLGKTATRRAKLTVRGTEAGDMRDAGKVQLYLDHLRNTKLKRMVSRETDLMLNWRQTYGSAFMAITWRQEWARDYVEVTLDQLRQDTQNPQSPTAAVSGQVLAGLYEPDPAVKKQLVNLLRQRFPDLSKTEAYRQLEALKAGNTMRLPTRYMRLNEPKWEALKRWRDVFMPTNMEDIQESPWIAWRRTFTAQQVREKEIGEGWAPEFVEAVLETTGRTLIELLSHDMQNTGLRTTSRNQVEEMEGLHEVFYFYHAAVDEHGVPCKHLTVMSPHVTAPAGEDAPVGLDQPIGYDHGWFPFVQHVRERPDRQAGTARGVPEILLTNQSELKHMRDARVNQTDLGLQPPVIRPEREVGLPLSWRPRGEIGERRMNQTREASVRESPRNAEVLELAAQHDAMRYFARNRLEDAARAALYDQDLADDVCEELGECWMHTLKLAQQFEDQVVFQQVVGGAPSTIRLTRDEIQGAADIQLFFNTDTLDPERMKAKVETLYKLILPASMGEIDMAPVVRGLMGFYFPEFADLALRGGEQATMKEVDDEETNWTKMIGGDEPRMVEEGQNFGLRLQWLDQKLNRPESQQLMQSLPWLEPLATKRREHLQFMVEQRTTNAQAGRVGVKPAA